MATTSCFLLFLLFLHLFSASPVPAEPYDPLSRILDIHERERVLPAVQEAAARGVLSRLLPSHLSSFDFQITPKEDCGGKFCFIISNHPSFDGEGTPQILIQGASGVELSAGLHWYLKHWCSAHISWEKTGGVQLSSVPSPGFLPFVHPDGVVIQRPVAWSYYQNAVTSSYSFAWWDWERWEKEIDWMALQGINLPLAFTGQEAIWQKVFQRICMSFNLSSADLDGFFGGPAFLAWARMGNLHGWGGPLPQSWLDDQLVLQKKILGRMYEFGMSPVLPAFSGNVPLALKFKFPSAKITRLGNWFTVDSNPRWCCTYLLDATDPLFVEIGKAFIQKQLEEYGRSSHVYNCDTFDENTPPVNDPNYISSLGAAIYRGMQTGDGDAIWLMQGWLFSYDPFWEPPQMKALLHSVPIGRLIVLDLYAEVKPVWISSQQFYGVPYIWCMLHNFAGNIEMYGILDAVGAGPIAARTSENSTMVGVGMCMEGIEQNPVVYDLMSEMAFHHKNVDVKSWMNLYVVRRYGMHIPAIEAAWEILYHTLYNCTDGANEMTSDGKKVGKDPCWEYGERVASDTGKVRCKFCLQVFSGGISRFKAHLAGKRGNCVKCDKVPDGVKQKVSEMLENANRKKDEKEAKMNILLSDVHIGGGEENLQQRNSSSQFKTKGSMDSFAYRTPEETTAFLAKGKQPVMDSKYRKKARDDAVRYIGKWFYEAGIPFNTASLPSFQQMIHAIGQFGGFMQAPTPYELRDPVLLKEVNETQVMIDNFKKNCAVTGCSILTDAWSDRKRRSIMNIVVHSSGGVAFLSSQDVSADKHDGHYIMQFVNKAIDELEQENVVQIVTDGASNNMAAATSLAHIRPSIFWTTCAAHTVNLMLCDIAKLKPIRSAIMMGRTVSVYIYSHTKSLQLLREFTNGEILRPGATRFATSFLSLQSMREKKNDLRKMFISEKWLECGLSTTAPGKKVAEIIGSKKFWERVEFALQVFTPLVKVLRRVDSDKTPSMGFVYGDMVVAKEELKVALENDEKKFDPLWTMVERRWVNKLMTPLHKAGYYLNPYFFYPSFAEIEKDGTFVAAVVECMHKFYRNDGDTFTMIGSQLSEYQYKRGTFGSLMAVKQAEKANINPVTWWNLFGNDTPDLKRMAMRILSLTASSSACERNWSTFEMVIHLDKLMLKPRSKFLQSDKNRDVIVAFPDVDPSSILIPEVFNNVPRLLSSRQLSEGKEQLKGAINSFDQPHLWYSTTDVVHALELFLTNGHPLSHSNTFRYDLVDLTRQALAKYANQVFLTVIEAYHRNDIEKAISYSQQFLDLVSDLDMLLSTHDGFLLGPWLESAKNLAKDPEQEKQYEWNARTQITMWFDNTETEASLLRDYGNKYWSGLLVDYYKPRAAIYFKYMIESMEKGESFRLHDWRREWIALTNEWQSSRKVFPVKGSGDALDISQFLYDKYLRDSNIKVV